MSTVNPPLRERIAYWIGQGYVVRSETADSAQLVRSRRFNPVEFIAMPIYLIEYLGQKDRSVYLSVEPDGTVKEQGSALDRSRYRKAQEMSARTRWAIVFGPIVLIIVIVVVVQAVT